MRHNRVVLPGIEKSDTLAAIGLLYECEVTAPRQSVPWPAVPALGPVAFGLESRIHDSPGLRP